MEKRVDAGGAGGPPAGCLEKENRARMSMRPHHLPSSGAAGSRTSGSRAMLVQKVLRHMSKSMARLEAAPPKALVARNRSRRALHGEGRASSRPREQGVSGMSPKSPVDTARTNPGPPRMRPVALSRGRDALPRVRCGIGCDAMGCGHTIFEPLYYIVKSIRSHVFRQGGESLRRRAPAKRMERFAFASIPRPFRTAGRGLPALPTDRQIRMF